MVNQDKNSPYESASRAARVLNDNIRTNTFSFGSVLPAVAVFLSYTDEDRIGFKRFVSFAPALVSADLLTEHLVRVGPRMVAP
jgi:hypothetical protein